jgi:2-polyprenyl-3-methyl-5-hydroxy-6-metoxy-1,4-benzoquinol methylase
MESFWNEKYNTSEYIYGIHPNEFFAEQLTKLKPGKILLPCEGEGRNAVFAAAMGWKVDAFDISEIGKIKAETLANENSVIIQYQIAKANTYLADPEKYDVIAYVYAHFPSDIRKDVFDHLNRYLKPGGTILIEAFNTSQINNQSGGPKDIDLLYSHEILEKDFKGFEISLLEEKEISLEEGSHHRGLANIIRLIAKKPA